MRQVEWIGLPGSGKSTLAGDVARWARSATRVVELEDVSHEHMRGNVTDPLWRSVSRVLPAPVGRRFADSMFLRSADHFNALRSFLVEYPHVFEVALRAQARRSGYELMPDMVIGWLLGLAARFTVAARLPGDPLIVMAEGFANRAVTLVGYKFGPADESDLRAYIEAIPRPRAVIYVATPPEVCASRLTDWSVRLQEIPASDRSDFLSDAHRCLQIVAESLRQRAVPVYVVENDVLDQASESVRAALTSLVASPT